MTTPPPDDGLPRRLRAQAFIAEGERRVARTWLDSVRSWFGLVRPAVLRRGVDPGRVSDYQGPWTDAVNVQVLPVVRGVLTDAWRRVTSVGRPREDPWVAEYLNSVGNRLVRLPDEVYALIVAEIERGIREGTALDTVAERVDGLLRVTGSERWPNRAVTVARTETMGAVNAGIFRSAELDALERGDPAPFKVWLSTDDSRTRPTHVLADQQRTLLRSPFQVGASALLFPGDPRGAAAEVINCRCTMLPVVLGEEIDWTDRQFRRSSDGA